MFLRRLLKDCSSQLQRHPQRSLSYVSKLLNLSKNPNLVQQKKYLHRMTPLYHETDHEVLSRPDEITCTFITKDGQRISVKGKIFIRPKHLIKTSQTKLIHTPVITKIVFKDFLDCFGQSRYLDSNNCKKVIFLWQKLSLLDKEYQFWTPTFVIDILIPLILNPIYLFLNLSRLTKKSNF